MDLEIIREAKIHIEDGNLEYLQEQFGILMNTELPREPDWPFIFQKIYLHACLKGQHEIANWLTNSVYPTMEPIQKIALRQVFSYGRKLLIKADKLKEARSCVEF